MVFGVEVLGHVGSHVEAADTLAATSELLKLGAMVCGTDPRVQKRKIFCREFIGKFLLREAPKNKKDGCARR